MASRQSTTVATIGVGIDTSRYAHHVSFLRDDLQPATEPIAITETKEGYAQLLSTLRQLKRRHPNVEFQIRLDEAGQYAANLRTFLDTLPFEKTVSIGDCVRNKNDRAAHFPKRKSDSVDSLSVARFAVRPGPKTRMSKKGNDLVRHYLFTASMSAVLCNPAVRALYRRLRARGTTGKVALGHAMRKLLHLAFAVWKSGKPFDPQHYPWDQTPENKEAAGHKQETNPDQQVVTATPTQTLSRTKSEVNNSPSGVDFQAVRSQTSIEQVLEWLDFDPVETRGDQVRGACPVHGSTSPRSRSFSASLTKNTYRSFQCPSQGDHLDLWAAATSQSIDEAAIELCEKVPIELPRIPFLQHGPPTREEEPVISARNSNKKTASSPPSPIDKAS